MVGWHYTFALHLLRIHRKACRFNSAEKITSCKVGRCVRTKRTPAARDNIKAKGEKRIPIQRGGGKRQTS